MFGRRTAGAAIGAVVGAVTVAALVPTALADTKVPRGAELKKAVEKLYDLKPGDPARETVFVEIDGILAKDKKNEAMKTPQFWVEAMSTAQWDSKRKSGKTKIVTPAEMSVTWFEGSGDKVVEKSAKVPYVYYAPAIYSPANSYPFVVCVVEKGTDPKAYLEKAWLANEDVKKGWVLMAVAESENFDLSKHPSLLVDAFAEIRNLFNVDPNRWYLEGVGAAAQPVQKAAATSGMASRIAGIVLRNPTEAVTSDASSMYHTVVVHAQGADDPSAKVVEAYKAAVGEDRVHDVAVADAAATTTPAEPLAAWLTGSPGRPLPAKYGWATTLTDNQKFGETWTGALYIVNPGKWNEPTTVHVEFDKPSNTVKIDSQNLGEFVLYMNDDLLDLDKPVAIQVNGQEVAKRVFERHVREIFETADGNAEYGRVFTASYRGQVPVAIAPPDADKGDKGDKKDDGAGGGDKGGDKGGDNGGGSGPGEKK